MRLLSLGAAGLLSWHVTGVALPESGSSNGHPHTSRLVPRSHVLHERHLADHTKLWNKRSRADAKALLPVRIGLTQQNLDEGHRRLWDISDPASPNYGKHLSPEEVVAFFAPKEDGATAVTDWLVAEGISANRISRSRNRQWIQFDATVEEVEALLYADFHVYEHADTGVVNLACSGYHLPASIREHIDYVTPGIKLMPEEGVLRPKLKRDAGTKARPGRRPGRPGRVTSDSLLKEDLPVRPRPSATAQPAVQAAARKGSGVTPASLDSQADEDTEEGTEEGDEAGDAPVIVQPVVPEVPAFLPPDDDCVYDVTPECIRAQYNIPAGSKNQTGNKLGIFQGLNIRYWQGDFDLFFDAVAPWVPQGSHPQNNLANGAIGETDDRLSSGAEAVMDFQLGMSLVWPQETVLWHVDDPWYEDAQMQEPLIYKGFFNNLFNAMDGSYCEFEAYNQTGNCVDPECLDPIYPNPNPGGYDGPLACGTFEPTNVISISYSGSESSLPASYLKRQCAEIMKLAMQGITVVVSSGDYGVGSNRRDPPPLGCLGENYDVFNPVFPGNCPYVLAVGATEWRKPKAEVIPPDVGGVTEGDDGRDPEDPRQGGDSGRDDGEDGGRGGEEGGRVGGNDGGRGVDVGLTRRGEDSAGTIRKRKKCTRREEEKNEEEDKQPEEGEGQDEPVAQPAWATPQQFTGPYEEVATTFFSSGGGFSNVYPVPEYQRSHHRAYFSALGGPANATGRAAGNQTLIAPALDVEGYVGGRTDYETIGDDGLRFNRAGRGTPDVSAIGDNIYVVLRGRPVLMMGTSASAPIVAAMLNLVNEERLAAGKSTVGWVHPVIYSHPEIFQDITEGSNPNCMSDGFPAIKGWDPVTGLGTPKYPKLLEVFMSLP